MAKKIKHGDIIEITFEFDSCWGREGKHRAIVLYNGDELIVHYLDMNFIEDRNEYLKEPSSDSLNDLFNNCIEDENIEIIGNIYENKDLVEKVEE